MNMYLLNVTVKRAKFLGLQGSQLSTYVTLQLQNVKSTTIIVKGDRPAWEQDFLFETSSLEGGLLVEVWTKGLIWDKVLGYYWMPLQHIPFTNEDSPGNWIELDSELVMLNGVVVGTQGSTGHQLFIDCRFELPYDMDDAEALELQRRLELFNEMMDSDMSGPYDPSTKRQQYVSQQSGQSEDSDYTSDVYPLTQSSVGGVPSSVQNYHQANGSVSQYRTFANQVFADGKESFGEQDYYADGNEPFSYNSRPISRKDARQPPAKLYDTHQTKDLGVNGKGSEVKFPLKDLKGARRPSLERQLTLYDDNYEEGYDGVESSMDYQYNEDSTKEHRNVANQYSGYNGVSDTDYGYDPGGYYGENYDYSSYYENGTAENEYYNYADEQYYQSSTDKVQSEDVRWAADGSETYYYDESAEYQYDQQWYTYGNEGGYQYEHEAGDDGSGKPYEYDESYVDSNKENTEYYYDANYDYSQYDSTYDGQYYEEEGTVDIEDVSEVNRKVKNEQDVKKAEDEEKLRREMEVEEQKLEKELKQKREREEKRMAELKKKLEEEKLKDKNRQEEMLAEKKRLEEERERQMQEELEFFVKENERRRQIELERIKEEEERQKQQKLEMERAVLADRRKSFEKQTTISQRGSFDRMSSIDERREVLSGSGHSNEVLSGPGGDKQRTEKDLSDDRYGGPSKSDGYSRRSSDLQEDAYPLQRREGGYRRDSSQVKEEEEGYSRRSSKLDKGDEFGRQPSDYIEDDGYGRQHSQEDGYSRQPSQDDDWSSQYSSPREQSFDDDQHLEGFMDKQGSSTVAEVHEDEVDRQALEERRPLDASEEPHKPKQKSVSFEDEVQPAVEKLEVLKVDLGVRVTDKMTPRQRWLWAFNKICNQVNVSALWFL